MAPVKKKDNTSAQRLCKYRLKLFSNKELHAAFKSKDAARKRLSRAAAAPLLTDKEKEEKRREARERQQKSREKRKANLCSTSPENSRAKVKNALRRQHRRSMVKFNPRSGSRPKQTAKPISNVAEVPQVTVSSIKSDDSNIAKVMWDVLSPNGKKKMKLNLFNSSKLGVNTAFRKKLGINLSNEVCVKSSQKDSNGGEN